MWSSPRADPPPCRRCRDLPALIQGELAPPAARALEDHVAGCAPCRAEMRRIEALLRTLDRDRGRDRGPPRPSSGSGLSERVLAALPPQAFPARTWRRAPAAAFAGLALAVGVILVALGTRPDPAPPPRTAPAMRAAAAARVEAGLRWLQRAQEPDGSWSAARWGGDARYDHGVTGLALSALAAVPAENPQRRAAIDEGLGFLIRGQDASGRFGPEGPGSLYNHGPATVALLQVLERHPGPRLRRAVDRAVRFIVRAQEESGGWGYGGGSRAGANLVISAWPIEALIRAEQQRIGRPGPALEAAGRWLDALRDGRGRLGYSAPGDFPNGSGTLDAVGSYCSRLLGAPAAALPADSGEPARDFLGLYFKSAAGHADAALAAAVLRRSQVAHGPHAGSWRPRDPWGPDGGRVYATSMAVLALAERGGAR